MGRLILARQHTFSIYSYVSHLQNTGFGGGFSRIFAAGPVLKLLLVAEFLPSMHNGQ